MTTAGYSPSEVARFASAELLRRAWFTLPLCDVLRSVQVSVASTVALRTREVVAITGSHRTTHRTPLAGVVRIDLLDTDTSAFGLVRDELLKLVEVPRMNARPRTVLADAFEVFHPDHGILELFRERDETTGEFVIQVFDSTLFFVTHTVACAKRGISIHFQPDDPYASHVEVARIDTAHGEPHFDRLYEPDQHKDWLGQGYTYEDARRELLSNWREYADQFFENHYPL